VARKRLVECSFFIPVRGDRSLSDGAEHPRDTWKWLDDRLYDFGGASRANDLYEGWYRDPQTGGEPVWDLSKKYIVAVSRKELSRLRALLRTACKVFSQKCIYLSVAGQVELVQRSKS